MGLSVFNTLTKKQEDFQSIVQGHVGLYSCGPTVYLRASIGNLRAYIFVDLLKRVLREDGYIVKHVMNITDVGHLTDDASDGEDKVEKTAKASGKTAWDIAKEYTELFISDMRSLHIIEPDVMPKATEHIDQQIELIRSLEEKGFTYKISDGVYFDTSMLGSYGKLSGQNLEDKQEGARVQKNPEKRNATDFALWKFSKTPGIRQMEWESPWGLGFPGWHIECSAMSEEYLGVPFDIHTGGIDHIPVHHTNEIAQTQAAREKPLAHIWMHNEFLQVDGGKMAKSLGNIYSLDDLQEKGFNPLAYRYFLLGAHYRQPQNFTWQALDAAQNALQKLQKIIIQLPHGDIVDENYKKQFLQHINDDLNIPSALADLWQMLKDERVSDESKYATAIYFDKIFGLGLSDMKKEALVIPQEVQDLLDLRKKARDEKQWEMSDAIRGQIQEHGYEVKDTKEGQVIEPIV